MTFKNIVVVGGGVIGSQIAFQTAYCGFDVTILLRNEQDIEESKEKVENLKKIYLSTMEEMKTNKLAYCRGFSSEKNLTEEQIDELKDQVIKGYSNIKYSIDYEETFSDADFVIEAIFEDLQQKRELYANISKYLPKKTIIVTNSSTILPSQIADVTGRPEKFLAFHFANKIWKSNTVEVMMHAETNPDYFEIAINFAEQINMIPLRVQKEQKGYILNSILIPFIDAAEALWANEVAEPETIDKTWQLATGSKLGPFQIMDIVGINTLYNIKLMDPTVHDKKSISAKVAQKLKHMIDSGKLGTTTGEGFYKYY
ncbi:hypothetical protein PIROE2DRAFT_8061 [Piromyces sp. E2]|nr:hypothetical protein PIROE2DRAFT_8061 [Piromyces sp. E2]|eukprot:OUM64998.1 hypothetical protein PIROE2DRAFT_8061 [Piromyces sp. E2]